MRWFYPPPPWLKHLISQPSEATDAVSVGEIASELEMTARPEHDRDDDDPEDAEDGADDDDEDDDEEADDE